LDEDRLLMPRCGTSGDSACDKLSSMTTPVASAARTHAVEKPTQYLALLFLVSAVSFMDRQILAILLEPIKRELGASDTEMGLLTGFAFVLFFALASVPIARAADRYSRRNIIAIALTFWSVMTMLSGTVTTFLQLAVARVGLGVGEAAAFPASQSMLADLFPRDRRTVPLALFAVAVPVGTMLAFTIGGSLNAAIGWRMTLLTLGAAGILLAAVLLLTISEPQRGASEPQWIDTGQYGVSTTIGYLWSLRSLRFLAAGASLNFFAASAKVVWSAPFLIRVHGMSTDEAGAWLGITTGVGGIAGVLVGGLVVQRLARTDPAWMLRAPALSIALAVPFVVLFLVLPPSTAPAMNLGVSFFSACIGGPVLATGQALAKVRMRALAAALFALVVNFVGGGLGPLVVGLSSDLLAPSLGPSSIRYALLVPVVAALLGAAFCFARGARHLASELELARA
jgi:predicted MFS family arabinose efflux permease